MKKQEIKTAQVDFRYHIQKAMYNFILSGMDCFDMTHEEDNLHYNIQIIKGTLNKIDKK